MKLAPDETIPEFAFAVLMCAGRAKDGIQDGVARFITPADLVIKNETREKDILTANRMMAMVSKDFQKVKKLVSAHNELGKAMQREPTVSSAAAFNSCATRSRCTRRPSGSK